MLDWLDEDYIETIYISDEISKCEDIAELRSRIFPMIKGQQNQWVHKIEEILKENNYTKSKLAELCNVSRAAVGKWCDGSIPKNREMFLRIGMAANYTIEQMNQLLWRYGKYPALYSKSLEDCICIYVLSNNQNRDASEKYNYILEKIKANIINTAAGNVENISTMRFDEKLSDVQNDDELELFITENSAMFTYAYHKFYAYVKMCINENYHENASTSVLDMADGQGWSSSLRQCVSAIRQNKWFPTRNKIISLGLHLSMDREQIDKMLELAHMEPLCAKNIFESVIIFILEDASLNNMLDSESDEYDPDELCRYAKRVISELGLQELDFFISELNGIEDVN